MPYQVKNDAGVGEGHCWQKLNKKALVNGSRHSAQCLPQVDGQETEAEGNPATQAPGSRTHHHLDGSEISSQWGGTSSHLTSPPPKLCQIVLLDSNFPLGKQTDFSRAVVDA